MAPRKKKIVSEGSNGDYPTYTTQAGLVLKLRSISIFELEAVEQAIKSEFVRNGEPVEPPTYEVELAGGGKRKLPLRADILEKEGDQAETIRRQLDWQSHMNALGRMRAEITRIQTMLVLEGIDMPLPPPGSEWEKRCKRFGIPIPEDEDERLQFYKMSYCLRTADDLIGVQAEITQISSGMSNERKEAAKALFRRRLSEELGRPAGEVGTAGGDRQADTGG